MEYKILFAIIAFFSLLEWNRTYKFNIAYVLLILTLVFFSGTRFELGTDYNIYKNAFELSNEAPQLAMLEVEGLYILLSNFLKQFSLVLFMYALLSVTTKGYFFSHTKYKFTTLLLYYGFSFIFYDMGIIRQGLAFSACLFAMKFIEERKIIAFTAIILLSTIFVHRTSVIFYPMYFLLTKDLFSRRTFYVSLIISIIVGFTFNMGRIESLLSLLPGFFAKSVSTMLDSDYYIHSNSLWGFSEFRKLILVVVFYEFLQSKQLEVNEKMWLNMYIYGVLLTFCMLFHTTMKSRGTYYFCISEIFLIPLCISMIQNSTIRKVMVLGVIAYSYLYLQQVISVREVSNWANLDYLPYNSILY